MQMNKVLDPLRMIKPLLQHIKLDKKKAEAFPELLEVLKCHTQSTEFMIQFFKHAINKENCICKACSAGIIKQVRMPPSVYNKVREFPMPMPIPKPLVMGDVDLPYMTFAEAQVLPFTGEHQPSLVKSAARIAAAAKRKEASIAASRLAPSRVTNTLTSITKLKNRSNFKMAAATRVRGVVSCNTCFRPRCIYSQYAVVHMKPPLEENIQDPATPTSEEVK